MEARELVCRCCGGPLPEPFLDLGETPLANSYVSSEGADLAEPRYKLAVCYCPVCHLVQLSNTVPPEKLFSHYLYFSSFSDLYLAHAKEMAESLAASFNLQPDSRVLEIASNDGYLLQYFVRMGVRVLGVEPAKNIAEFAASKGIPTLNRFFGPDTAEEIRNSFGRADVIIGNNVLAHVPQITAFLDSVKECLKPRGRAVFEFPYLKDLLDQTEFDTIYHEHVFYYSASAIQNVAARAGLELVGVERQRVHGGSLRVFLAESGAYTPSRAVAQILAEEERAGLRGPGRYAAFSRQVAELKQDLLDALHRMKSSGRRIAAYGAPAKGNTLLNYCGITSELVEFTVDRSPHKQGKLLPGSRIPIRKPEALLEEMPDCTVILPWNLADEIIEQQRAYFDRGGVFLIPVPRPQVVGSPVLRSAGVF